VKQGREWDLARWVLVSVLAAIGVVMSSLQQAPSYQASALVLVDWKGGGQIQTLEYRVIAPTVIETMIPAIDSRPVAKETIQRLGLEQTLTPKKLLDKLPIEQVESTSFIRISYEDADPERAQQIANTAGQVASELISERSREFTVGVWEKAAVPERPVSPRPLRNGLLALVVGLMLSTVLALPQPRPLAARPPAVLRTDPHEAERIKEKKLLEALDRRGKLTAVEAALETGLTVDDANRILSDLANRGHLEFDIEGGKLLYGFWGSTDHEDGAVGHSGARP
jgi:capsular polysaccharide biosynthesis protein